MFFIIPLIASGCAWITDDEWEARSSVYDESCAELIWWLDGDGDGFGGGDGILRCDAPVGHTQVYGDCDDADPESFPGAPEVCDGRNNDCDADVDEDAPDSQFWFRDNDGDGFGTSRFADFTCSPAEGYVAQSSDCDDGEPTVYPGATEICDGLDNDCDEAIDVDAVDASAWFSDNDGDGYGDDASLTFTCEVPLGGVSAGGDCDDANSGIGPDAEEICGDGIDNNCDGAVGAGCATTGAFDLSPQSALGTASAGGAGTAVAGVGDVDGDGLADLLIGLPFSGVGDGGAALVSGLSGSLDEPIALFSGIDGSGAGAAVAGVSDLNRDGYGDFAVGGPGAGYVWVVYGAAEPLGSEVDLADAGAVIEEGGDRFGTAVSGVRSADEDLFPELLIGASEYDDGAGAAFLFPGPVLGALDALTDAGAVLVGDSGSRAGHSVAGAGDVDGDGISDLLVGAPGAGDEAGRAWVVFGPMSGVVSLADVGVALSGEADRGLAAERVEAGGDTDGDGYADVLMSATQAGEGEAYLFRGPVASDRSTSEADAVLQASSQRLNKLAVSSLDFDGDGVWDVFVGDAGAGEAEQGAVYGFYGPLSGVMPLEEADVQWSGPEAGAQVGASLGRVGDADGDGFSEIVVGAPGVDQGRGGIWLLEVAGL